ncbi:MAG: hypothetical protein AAF456_02995 [Planctomycetota bacterium]
MKSTSRETTTVTSAQFTTRQLLFLIVVASIVFAFLGNVLQNLTVKDWWRVMAYVGALIAIGLTLLVLAMNRRARAERKAGPSHLLVHGALTTWYHIAGITNSTLTLLVITGGLVKVAMPDAYFPALTSFLSMMTYIPILVLTAGSYFVCMVWWKVGPKTIDIRENGVIIGPFHFTSWQYLRGFKWNQFSKKLMLMTEGGYIEHKIPARKREKVAETLRNFLPEE